MSLRYVEKKEMPFFELAFACDRAHYSGFGFDFECELQNYECDCGVDDCPLCYPSVPGMDGDINTVIIIKEEIADE